MSKVVVLAEKPSVGRDLARVLKCHKKGNGYFEGNQYIVTWALGHLVTIADPEEYDEKYKKWNLEDLPMLPTDFKLVVMRQTSKQFHTVKNLMHRKDVSSIVIATDAGREGELVARWIIEKGNVKKPIKRLWISSVTDKAILDGFKKLKDGRAYDNLYASAVARAEADWIVGINATRALTCKYQAQLSCGRVQTPTLAMIARREQEIKDFKAQPFYGLVAHSQALKLQWQDQKSKDMRTFDKARADQLLAKVQGKDAKIIDIEKAYKKKYAPLLYDLTELQRDANRLFGYSAKETLSIMQSLYERHKLLTYPRTDSRYLSTDMVDTLSERIQACRVQPYASMASKILQKPIKANKSFVDNSKVSDHHAIIPTEEPVFLSKLSEKERRIYDLVVKRFLAVFYSPFEYEQTTIKTQIDEETFIAKGKVVLQQGWKEVYAQSFEDEEEDMVDQVLPKMDKGDIIQITSIIQTQGFTKPPAFFTEGTLLSAMENPSRFLDKEDKGLAKILGETGGIGTVATRADIIEKLLNSFLIEKRGQDLLITSKGKQLLDLVPEDLKSPALTGEWEKKLGQIAEGKLKKDTFIQEMRIYSTDIVKEIKEGEATFKHDNITGNRCPQCDKHLLEVKGKRGRMLVCQDRNCGYRKNIARETNARCPNCRKRLELHGEGDGQIFVCSCGHREKLSVFNERKKKQQNQSSKREVAKYLQQQSKKKEEAMNTDLASALSKLKLK